MSHQRNELVKVENENIDEQYEVFDDPYDGQHHYYLSVGHLGMGDEVLQVLFDPICELFIPLGNNLAEALAMLEQLKEFYKSTPGTTMEVQGCLALGFPTDRLETVTVTARKVLLRRKLEFSLQREGYIRATYVGKSDFSSLVRGVKVYGKIHPKEF
ncbi:MAG: hypothetical protein IJ760_01845 [Bacteroidales bacterium]|nr:hypothetical protein [Bacteroidales bacterium]